MNRAGIQTLEHLTFLQMRPTHTGTYLYIHVYTYVGVGNLTWLYCYNLHVTSLMYVLTHSAYAAYGFINIQRIIEESIIRYVSDTEVPNITLSMRVRWGEWLRSLFYDRE